MKVCDLTQSYADSGGGVRTYLHAKADRLLADGDVDYVRIVPGPADTVVRRGRGTFHTVASPRVPGSTAYRLLLRSDKVLRILDAEQPDLVEVHCAYSLPWTAFRHRGRAGCAVVGMAHTDVARAYVEAPVARVVGATAGRGARRLAEHYIRAVYRRCDATVAVSAAMAAELRGLGVGRVERIALGVDLALFHPDRRDTGVRQRLGAGPDDLLLVHVGRLDGEKRPNVLVDALDHLPPDLPVVLVLVGEGPLRPRLEARAARDRRLRVLPFERDRTAVAALLASADVYVSAMPHETFGLSVVEAQACGLPVLGVRAGAMVERIVPGTGILVDPDSPEALARRIADTPRELWPCMGARGRAHVEANFSWDRTFARLRALYDDVLARRGAVRAAPR